MSQAITKKERTTENTISAQTEGVVVQYDKETRIALPDLFVHPKETLVLVGPSGSGKTTLLHVLAGLLRPNVGAVYVAGQNMATMSERKLEPFRAQNIGVVFQDFHLVEGYSALDNVVVALLAAGESLPHALNTATQLLQELGVGHRLKHRPNQLSTGERQRVAIARAIATRPILLLADEPTANLDRARAENALKLLEEAAKNANAALIVSTHDILVKEYFSKHLTF